VGGETPAKPVLFDMPYDSLFLLFCQLYIIIAKVIYLCYHRQSCRVAQRRLDAIVKQFFRVDDVARLLGVTPQTIRNWIREGKITAKRFGRPHLIPVGEVARLLGTTSEEAARLLESPEDWHAFRFAMA
jgi:excisionase family DNA binding protein